jgi:hypothetical protein
MCKEKIGSHWTLLSNVYSAVILLSNKQPGTVACSLYDTLIFNMSNVWFSPHTFYNSYCTVWQFAACTEQYYLLLKFGSGAAGAVRLTGCFTHRRCCFDRCCCVYRRCCSVPLLLGSVSLLWLSNHCCSSQTIAVVLKPLLWFLILLMGSVPLLSCLVP